MHLGHILTKLYFNTYTYTRSYHGTCREKEKIKRTNYEVRPKHVIDLRVLEILI